MKSNHKIQSMNFKSVAACNNCFWCYTSIAFAPWGMLLPCWWIMQYMRWYVDAGKVAATWFMQAFDMTKNPA